MSFLDILVRILFALNLSFIPICNANSTVRRLPWITFLIIGANFLIYYGTLPTLAEDQKALIESGIKLEKVVMENPDLMTDDKVREKLIKVGLISETQEEEIKARMQGLAGLSGYSRDEQAFKELIKALDEFQTARESSLWFKFGLAPNGEWKAYQLITSAFFHGDFLHLFGNMIVFFAFAFTIEDLWGRPLFIGFYLFGAIASCIPTIVSPGPLAGIGASGALFATMGAFLVREPKTKIKLFIMPGWLIRFLIGRRSTIMIPGYVYLLFAFIQQFVFIYHVKSLGGIPTVGYTVHIAGFVFGVGFAAFMKASRIEQTYIHPKIEAKVSFSSAPQITQALEMIDRGDSARAERILRQYLAKQPDNPETLLALIQVYQRNSNFDQLNVMYGRLIHYHLGKMDKEAALFAYDTLLQAFPDDQVAARIPARDWIVLCEYLKEAEMNREASIEYERLLNAWPDDPLAVRAAVQGAEAAFAAMDIQRAYGLYQRARSMNPPQPLVHRIESGIEKCSRILDNRPKWSKQPPKAPTIYRGY